MFECWKLTFIHALVYACIVCVCYVHYVLTAYVCERVKKPPLAFMILVVYIWCGMNFWSGEKAIFKHTHHMHMYAHNINWIDCTYITLLLIC